MPACAQPALNGADMHVSGPTPGQEAYRSVRPYESACNVGICTAEPAMGSPHVVRTSDTDRPIAWTTSLTTVAAPPAHGDRLKATPLSERTMRLSVRIAASAIALAVFATTPAMAQQGATEASGPQVGDVAPDFTITGVTRHGVLRDPVKLSDYRGQTVVLAFFPKARTSGCTVQMETYRDRYADVFNGGRGVTLLAVSVDPDTALLSWARDADFPMLFGSDVNGEVARAYGAYRGPTTDRSLFVIDPQGKIAYVARPFRQMAEDAYVELGAVVDRLSPAPEQVGERDTP